MSMNPPTQSGGSGKHNWFLIAAGGASILGLFALLTKNSGGGTTAAGTSINAALGSLQEEQLNTQGQVGQLQQSIGLNPNETLTGHIDANQAATIGAISSVGTQVAGVGAAVGTASTQEQQDAAAQQTASAGFFSQLMGAIGGLLSGQQAGFASVNQGLTAVGSQVSGVSQQETNDVAGINSQLSALSQGQQQEIIQQILSDVHNQINFNAVQAGMNGDVNPAVAAHMSSAVNGTF